MINLDQAKYQDVLLHLPNNIYIPSWWSGGQGNRDTASADHMDERNSGSWCLSIFLTSFLVWEVLIPTLDAQLGNWKAMVSSGNNRDKWKILAKGSIRYMYPWRYSFVGLIWEAKMRNFLLFWSWEWPLSLSQSYQDRFIEFLLCILHVHCIMMLQH